MRFPRKAVALLLPCVALVPLFAPPLSPSVPTALPGGRHYVDSAATGLDNGTSWADAWTSFADIDWGVIQPGDILYISGGTSSRTYSEMLDVGASGTQDNPIVISRAADAAPSSSSEG